jgi:peptidoglycan/xylan/chitin deacetylase (PgdA/CDA1 family)
MRLLPPPRLSILIYHRVLAQPDPLFPGEVDAVAFDRQLGLLKRCFKVMPLLKAVRLLEQDRLPRRAACITFDDGYADNAQVALPILRRHGLCATFFIATGFLDGGQMWNDRVIALVRGAVGDRLNLLEHGLGCFDIGSLSMRRRAIAALLDALKYLAPEQRLEQVQRICGAGENAGVMMSSAQVLALHRSGMEIGAHTVSHPILARISDLAASAEIRQSRAQLECITGAPVSLFAYPNGKPGADYGQNHVDIVRQLGFQAAVATSWGTAGSGADRFQLPRFTPWDRNRLGFLLRMGQNMFRATPTRPG